MANYSKPDSWALRAQREGYPARSVYKLSELDEQFSLLRPHGMSMQRGISMCRILDLGAAPGSWSLYVLRHIGQACQLTACDLSPLSRVHDKGFFDSDNFFFIQGDMTDEVTRAAILERAPYHVVISDAAPATMGSRSIDTLRSLALAETALFYAESALATGGNFVVKVFQGGDTVTLLKRLREVFTSAKSFKPKACRRESFETYYLGLGKK
jgi:23S rRNA (uridine2552-2'-O)-methyltransferase